MFILHVIINHQLNRYHVKKEIVPSSVHQTAWRGFYGPNSNFWLKFLIFYCIHTAHKLGGYLTPLIHSYTID